MRDRRARRGLGLALLLTMLLPAVIRAQSFTCAAHGDGTCRDLIPDANRGVPGELTSKITVPADACSGRIARLRVGLHLIHDAIGDLRVSLTSPAGTAVTLLAPTSCRGDDVDGTFDDRGGSLRCGGLPAVSGTVRPAAPLAAFAGEAAGGAWTLRIADEAHSGLGALESWSVACPEDCEDCRDDDSNDLVDGADPVCPGANGSGAGLADPKAQGKPAVRCARTLQKLGGRFAVRRLARLQRCVTSVFKCVQRKPGDPRCLARATRVCAGQLGGLARDRGRFTAGVERACGPERLAPADLLAAAGLGFDGEAAACAERGVGTLASAGDVAACVLALHECSTDRVLGLEMPRAAELLALAGRDPSAELPCLGAGSDGQGVGVGGRSRNAVRCAAALTKAGTKLFAGTQKRLAGCAAASLTCVQRQPGNARCAAKAARICARTGAKTVRLESKHFAAVGRGCRALSLDDLLAPAGLGFAESVTPCATLDRSLGSAPDLAACQGTFHRCRARLLAGAEAPRLHELFGLAGVPVP